MLLIILGIVISYLIGSIPTAYIFGRLLKGIDIRKFGSGNIGATNAFRVLGRGAGAAVLLIDILKGFISVVFVGDYILLKALPLAPEALRIILGLSCICGHNWTIFLRFRGGKGVATTLGVLSGLAFRLAGLKIILGFLILTWLLIVVIIGIVSVASVLTAIALPVYMLIVRPSAILIATSILLCVFVIIRHKSNIKRLFQGKEPRLFFKKSQSQQKPT